MFRGQDEQQQQQQFQQMQSVLTSPLVSQPDDIAHAVWEAVKHQKADTVVGAAAIATEAHRLFPGLSQWLLGRAVS